MASGFAMILKQMGFDPEKVKAEILKAVEEARAQVDHFKLELKLLHEKLDRMEKRMGQNHAQEIISDDTTTSNVTVLERK